MINRKPKKQETNKKLKSLLSPESMKAHVEFLKKSNIPYQLKISNYTVEISSEIYSIQFVQSMRNKRCFAAFSKLKSEIRNKPVPEIKKSELKYFEHDFTKDFTSDNVINIDLRSAYPTILLNDGFISDSTFAYLSKIPKTDRLAAIGMLASKKYIFDYGQDGKLLNWEEKVSNLENFFFHCVLRTSIVMNDLKKICGPDYLFTWVDGIYFKVNDEILPVLNDYLETHLFKWSIDILEKFEVKFAGHKIRLSFYKEGKLKLFNIPSKSGMLANDIVNYLTNEKIYNEKNCNTKIPRNRDAKTG